MRELQQFLVGIKYINIILIFLRFLNIDWFHENFSLQTILSLVNHENNVIANENQVTVSHDLNTLLKCWDIISLHQSLVV